MSSVTFQTTNDPALTHTLDEFIEVGEGNDEQNYYNFSIFEKSNGILLLDRNVVDDYIEMLNNICVDCNLSDQEFKTYKYQPDLLAYDVYKSTQLDFIILKANDMSSYKEFNRMKIRLPYASHMKAFLSAVYNAEYGYLGQNRLDLGIYT